MDTTRLLTGPHTETPPNSANHKVDNTTLALAFWPDQEDVGLFWLNVLSTAKGHIGT